jgi:hypothetical protein
LGYYPPAGQAGERRQIMVRVNQPDLVVKSRESYVYAQKDGEKDTQPAAGTTPQPKHLSGTRE